MLYLLSLQAQALECTGLVQESCDATNQIVDQLEVRSPGTISDVSPNVRLRPTSIYAAVEEIRQAGAANGCEAGGRVVLGTEAGTYTRRGHRWSGDWASMAGGGGTAEGTWGGGLWTGTFQGDASGAYGAIDAQYWRSGQIVGDRDTGFSAGGWARVAGGNGIWFLVYGSCAADYRQALDDWFDGPLVIDGDGDGHPPDTDCDDTDPLVFPGATELCDGHRNDCSDATWTMDSEPTLSFERVVDGTWSNLAAFPTSTSNAGRFHVCADVGGLGSQLAVGHSTTEIVGERPGERPTVDIALSVQGFNRLTVSDVTLAGAVFNPTSAASAPVPPTFRATRTNLGDSVAWFGQLRLDEVVAVDFISQEGRMTLANSTIEASGALSWIDRGAGFSTSTISDTALVGDLYVRGSGTTNTLEVVDSSLTYVDADGDAAIVHVTGGTASPRFWLHLAVADNDASITFDGTSVDWPNAEIVRLDPDGTVAFVGVSSVQPTNRVRFFDGSSTTFQTMSTVGGLFDFACTQGVGCSGPSAP